MDIFLRFFALNSPLKDATSHRKTEGRAISMLLNGITQNEVARRLNVTKSTISRLRRRLANTTSVKDRPRSGRPRTTTRRQDQQIRLTHLRHRSQTAATILGRNNVRISAKTVRNRLRALYGFLYADVDKSVWA